MNKYYPDGDPPFSGAMRAVRMHEHVITRGQTIVRSQPKIFRSKKDRRAARQLMKELNK